MKLSVVIPAHNEAGCIEKTILSLMLEFRYESIDVEILVINDHSTDETESILKQLSNDYPEISYLKNPNANGFGFAVRHGLENFTGDAVVVVMADGSDDPKDVVIFYKTLQKGYDCVFGSRFSQGGKINDYPKFKLVINRMANLFIQTMFGMRYNDTTNAFKMYRSETIEGLKPFLSHHFNLTVELPLKAIVRGYSYAVIPNSWSNRKTGESKLRLKEMGSRYLFIVLYCLIEKWLSVGDYRKPIAEKDQRTSALRNSGEKPNGGQPGHEGHGLEPVKDPKHFIVHEVECCKHCKRAIDDIPANKHNKRQVLDIPPV